MVSRELFEPFSIDRLPEDLEAIQASDGCGEVEGPSPRAVLEFKEAKLVEGQVRLVLCKEVSVTLGAQAGAQKVWILPLLAGSRSLEVFFACLREASEMAVHMPIGSI